MLRSKPPQIESENSTSIILNSEQKQQNPFDKANEPSKLVENEKQEETMAVESHQ